MIRFQSGKFSTQIPQAANGPATFPQKRKRRLSPSFRVPRSEMEGPRARPPAFCCAIHRSASRSNLANSRTGKDLSRDLSWAFFATVFLRVLAYCVPHISTIVCMYQALHLHLRLFRPHENHLKSLRGSSSPDDHRIHGSFGLISPPTLQQTSSDPVILMASLN